MGLDGLSSNVLRIHVNLAVLELREFRIYMNEIILRISSDMKLITYLRLLPNYIFYLKIGVIYMKQKQFLVSK